jgi:hypothetical protein
MLSVSMLLLAGTLWAVTGRLSERGAVWPAVMPAHTCGRVHSSPCCGERHGARHCIMRGTVYLYHREHNLCYWKSCVLVKSTSQQVWDCEGTAPVAHVASLAAVTALWRPAEPGSACHAWQHGMLAVQWNCFKSTRAYIVVRLTLAIESNLNS